MVAKSNDGAKISKDCQMFNLLTGVLGYKCVGAYWLQGSLLCTSGRYKILLEHLQGNRK